MYIHRPEKLTIFGNFFESGEVEKNNEHDCVYSLKLHVREYLQQI